MIKELLQGMLMSKTIKEWDGSYESTRFLLRNCPMRKELLDTIYLNLVYYTGYYIRGTKCDLNVLGTKRIETFCFYIGGIIQKS